MIQLERDISQTIIIIIDLRTTIIRLLLCSLDLLTIMMENKKEKEKISRYSKDISLRNIFKY